MACFLALIAPMPTRCEWMLSEWWRWLFLEFRSIRRKVAALLIRDLFWVWFMANLIHQNSWRKVQRHLFCKFSNESFPRFDARVPKSVLVEHIFVAHYPLHSLYNTSKRSNLSSVIILWPLAVWSIHRTASERMSNTYTYCSLALSYLKFDVSFSPTTDFSLLRLISILPLGKE